MQTEVEVAVLGGRDRVLLVVGAAEGVVLGVVELADLGVGGSGGGGGGGGGREMAGGLWG